MNNNKRGPFLRFPEFKGDWEVKKIDKVGKITTGSTPLTSNQDYYNGSYLFVSPFDIKDSKYVFSTKTTLTKSGYEKCRNIKAGSVAFVCIGSTIGKLAIVPIDFATNQQINSITAYEFFSNDFIYYSLSNIACQIKLLAGIQAVPLINKSDFSKIKINLPTLPEQQKIADYLSTIDNKIELLQEKKTKLEQYKKAMMQKLFSQEIRFKDENGNPFPDWEEKRLGEVSEINKGQQLNKEHFVADGVYKVVNGGISHSGFTNNFNRKGDVITISEGGNSCGFTNFITEDFWMGGHCYAIDNLIDNLDVQFLFQYLKFMESKIMRLRVGSGLPNIQKGDLSNFVIITLIKEEQKKIANFLSTLDEGIATVEEQIQQTQSFKKAMLQQMFV